jgi:hypothetical protein
MPKRFTHDHLVGAFHIWHRADQVELSWESRGKGSHLWRVIRSEERLSPPIDPLQSGGRLIMEGDKTHVIDEEVPAGTDCFYTLLVHHEGRWVPEIEARVRAGNRLSWLHSDQERSLAASHDLASQGTYIIPWVEPRH